MRNVEELHDYQRFGVQHIVDNPNCGLFLDMGMGKTVTVLTALKKLMFEELDVIRPLIVAPKRVAENVWSDEMGEWSHLNSLSISVIKGDLKNRLKALNTPADIYSISRDNIAWLCGNFGGKTLPFDTLVVDESSSFKNHKSVRFKSLKMVQPSLKRVIILTGTPSPNGLIDLWPQVWLLDRGERLGKTISIYRERFFKPGKRNGSIVYDYRVQEDGESRIHDKVKDICISMSAEDYLDLPETRYNYVEVVFDPETMMKYHDFEKELVLTLFDGVEEKDISVVNAAALTNKLLQFANGAVYDNDRNVIHVHDYKLEALEEIVESSNGKPILIGWTFKHDRDRIMEKFKSLKPRQLETRQDILDWNEGKIQMMTMHPASGGHGLNLQNGGNTVVWFGLTWSLELYQQFNKRLDRQGQKNGVTIHHIMSKQTMDYDVINSLHKKDKNQKSLLDSVKAIIRKYR